MSENIGTFEAILVGVLAIGLVWWLAPGIKRTLEERPRATSRDWLAFAGILALVAVFVLLLVSLL